MFDLILLLLVVQTVAIAILFHKAKIAWAVTTEEVRCNTEQQNVAKYNLDRINTNIRNLVEEMSGRAALDAKVQTLLDLINATPALTPEQQLAATRQMLQEEFAFMQDKHRAEFERVIGAMDRQAELVTVGVLEAITPAPVATPVPPKKRGTRTVKTKAA